MDRSELRSYFDEAVKRGDEDEAVIYGTDLSDLGAGARLGDMIHAMQGFKELQQEKPEKYIHSAIMYVSLAYRLSKACRSNDGWMWESNLKETEEAAAVANMYAHPKFDEFWDLLRHENICWTIIASENVGEPEKSRYKTRAKELMDNTEIRHSGDWFMEYYKFFEAHGI